MVLKLSHPAVCGTKIESPCCVWYDHWEKNSRHFNVLGEAAAAKT